MEKTEKNNRLAWQNDRKKLFVIGDSISIHYGPFLKQYISIQFDYDRKGAGKNFSDLANAEVNGGDSSCVLAYLNGLLSGNFSCDYLLINCGLHDIKTDLVTRLHQVPLELYSRNLIEIVRKVKAAGITMLWARITPIDDEIHHSRPHASDRYSRDIDEYNATADEIMQSAGIPMIDLHDFTLSVADELYCDHVHFHEPIRKLQAAFIAGFILNL